MVGAAIVLPSGLWVEGVHHREAELRPLTGEDEAFLLEAAAELPPARRTTALLSRCLTRLGPYSPAPVAAVRALTVGDREALLLHLRRLTLGERLECVLRCPAPGCGEPLELDLAVSDLLAPPADLPAPLAETAGGWHEEVIHGVGAWRVRFRLPNGEDQELAADLTAAGGAGDAGDAGAVALLLGRCVASAVAVSPVSPALPAPPQSPDCPAPPASPDCQAAPPSPDGPAPSTQPAAGGPPEMPAAVIEAVAGRMAALDPQAEISLRVDCPSCGRAMSALFDAGEWFCQEMAARAADLHREIHLLALHYHWREADVLAMTGRKRRLYLGLLAETLGWEGRS
jgi:hypothetical protein